jgi:hypothetical protein
VPELLSDAHPGAAWRTEFGIAEPSSQLSQAIDVMAGLVSPSGPSTFDALIAATTEDRPGEARLATLVRQVLRSTLEEARSRQPTDVDRHP